jgi:parvulin-like peptidyl-prolyl isomerase
MFRRLCVSAAWLAFLPALAPAMPGSAPGASQSRPAAAPGTAPAGAPEGVYAYLTRDGAQSKVSLFAPESRAVPIARVEDEVILLEELTRALASAHGDVGPDAATAAGKKDFRGILERMIEVRLLAAEAREMGIDELPEVKRQIEDFREATGQELLKARIVAGAKPDPAQVERLYRDAVREWKVQSVLFGGELDAKQHAPKLKAPKAFESLAKQLVADKKAKGAAEAQFLPRDKMLPQVLAALTKLKVGEVSDPVRVGEGFAVLKVEAVRYPEVPKARAEAEMQSLMDRQGKALQSYYDGLLKRYAKVDRALFKSLDFHAKKPGLAALEKDARVLAVIPGGKNITVGEFTKTLTDGFYHGVENALKEKKINKQKDSVFDGMLSKRVIPLQVRADRIDESPEFARRVAEQEMSILFSRFIEKAILPSFKISEADVKKHYAEHRKEFMYPTFYKLESLAFAKLSDAEGAVKKLRSGTDFKWLNANADGQIPPPQRKLGIEGTLAATALPKEIAAALAGARKGDYRLHAGPDSQYYAIRVVDVIGATEQPLEEVEEGIRKELFDEALAKGVKKWADTLRQARKVEVFITRIGS